jgi:D-alanyl-D-alanine carboxypeptidase
MFVGKKLTVLFRPSKMTYDSGRSLSKTKRMKAALTLGLSSVFAIAAFGSMQALAVIISGRSVVYAEELVTVSYSPEVQVVEGVPIEKISDTDKQAVQRIVDEWSATYKGNGSVYITDTKTGDVLATSDENRQFFTASMYKMYVAYLGLQDVDAGKTQLEQPFMGGKTRRECLYLMIQESNSSCAV